MVALKSMNIKGVQKGKENKNKKQKTKKEERKRRGFTY